MQVIEIKVRSCQLAADIKGSWEREVILNTKLTSLDGV